MKSTKPICNDGSFFNSDKSYICKLCSNEKICESFFRENKKTEEKNKTKVVGAY